MNELSLGLLLSLLGVCMVLSAFFSGTETALMSINRYQLRTLARKGHRGALVAEKLLERPDKLIGLILLGNNLVNNLAATLVAVIVLQQFDDEWLAVGAGVLTLLMLIFCEVGPKTLGALHPKPVALASAHIYRILGWCLYPAVWIINRVTNGMLRLVGIKVDQQTQQTALTQEELRTVVAEAGVLIPQRHRQMLMSILDLERVTVDDINLLIPHQANLRISEGVQKALKLPDSRVYNNIQKYGNTTAATIPIAYDECKKSGKVKQGDLVAFCGLGAGFHWGAALMRE